MPKQIKYAIILVVLVLIYSTISSLVTKVYLEGKILYNTTVDLKLQETAKTQELVSTYDAEYLSFVEQYKLTNVNKDAFIQVTNIVMSNRKDGKNVAWKWMQENQPIPYEQFTSFYAQLIQFTQERFNILLSIEKSRQNIVLQHNKLITTFPNTIYNRYLKIKPLEYKFGYVSDSTKKLFGIQ